MYDHLLYVKILRSFTQTLVGTYDVDRVLAELTENVTAAFDLVGSGVILMEEGRAHLARALNLPAMELEQMQQDHQQGPGLDAIRTGDIVAISDLHQASELWPEYVAVAERHGVHSVVGIPLTLADETIGTLNLYAGEPRAWSSEDLLAARALADVATGYLVNASKLDQQRRLNEQLQRALDQRMVIEQAKGITAHAHNTNIDEAFALIRRHARNHNASIQTVAEAVVNAGLRV